MPQETNIELARRWFQEMWNERQLDTIERMLAPDVVSYEIVGPETQLRGHEEFRAAARQLLGAFGELHFTIDDIFGVDDRVAVRLTVRLRHTGSLGDLPPSGKSMTLPVMCMLRVRDGMFVEGWNSWDVGAVLRQAKAPEMRRTLF